VGEEAYIPANETRQFGLFTLQEFDLGAVRLEGGARYEHANVKSAQVGRERTFNSVSFSVGGSVDLGSGFRLALSGARTERAPSAEELFASGAHAATRAVEIGNPDFSTERQLGAEAVLRGRGDGWRLELSAFVNRFDNYIFLNPNGLEQDELPVFEYAQSDASFWGVEVEAGVKVAQLGATRFEVTGLLDYTRATILSGGGAVPRLPPLRMIGGIEATGGVVGGLVLEHVGGGEVGVADDVHLVHAVEQRQRVELGEEAGEEVRHPSRVDGAAERREADDVGEEDRSAVAHDGLGAPAL
jgi:iron complex outermembrane receptor protein